MKAPKSPRRLPCPALRIGLQTSFAAAHFLDPFRYAVANGFEAFEWFPDRKPSGAGWDETDLSPELCEELREMAAESGMSISFHARWTANPLQPDGLAILLKDVEMAKSLGSPLLNLHLYTDGGVAAYAASLRPVLDAAARQGLRISIENTVETPPSAFNELFERLHKAEPNGHVGMCLDIGHANLCTSTRNNYLAFVDQLNSGVSIIHLHLHENWGDADAHLPLFTGPAGTNPAGVAGLLKRLATRRYTGAAILEQWPNPPALLNTARDRLRELLLQRGEVPCSTLSA
jgi:sugar phosphate isomerase/epimerase